MEWQNEVQGLADYEDFFYLEDFGRVSPSQFIYITEAHSSLRVNAIPS